MQIASMAIFLVAAALTIVMVGWLWIRSTAAPMERLTGVSVEQYAPMLRLLRDDDIYFLLRQPGGTQAMVDHLRRQRCQMFQAYLKSLRNDFDRASRALISLVLQSKSDRADLAYLLVRSRLVFLAGMVSVSARVFLYRRGIGTVDGATVLCSFVDVDTRLRELGMAS